MSPASASKIERARLADAMSELGAEPPTLCEGWTNYDMAAHLVVREHKPVASLGIISPPMSRLHDNAIEKAKKRHSFDSLIQRFRSGPPLTWKPVDNLFNTQEHFIHHEDVRRGGGERTPRPRHLIEDVEHELWNQLRRAGRWSVRGIKGIGIELITPDGEVIRARQGEPRVSILGRPGEVMLYLAGRRSAAQVELMGPTEAVMAVEAAKLGL